jgi:hypothetical protein
MKTARDIQEKLEHALKTGEPKDFYRPAIENMGWQITSVNYDKPDYLEYETVKGDDSYKYKLISKKTAAKQRKSV